MHIQGPELIFSHYLNVHFHYSGMPFSLSHPRYLFIAF